MGSLEHPRNSATSLNSSITGAGSVSNAVNSSIMANRSASSRGTRWKELYASARGHFLTACDAASRQNVPLIVGGLSLGAVLSLLLAAEFPRNTAGVICLSATLFYDGWNVPWTQRLIGVADYLPGQALRVPRERSPYGLKDEHLRRRVAEAYAMSPRDPQMRRASVMPTFRFGCFARCGISLVGASNRCRRSRRLCSSCSSGRRSDQPSKRAVHLRARGLDPEGTRAAREFLPCQSWRTSVVRQSRPR